MKSPPIAPGLASVTFRGLSPRAVVEVALEAGLVGIEWGGDVHVPVGGLAKAQEVGQMTRDAGLAVVSYGSYYRCDGVEFEKVLETAQALGAPEIRVWAGTSESDFGAVVEDLQRIGQFAAINLEYHAGTFTSSGESALRLMRAVGLPSVRLYWQPDVHLSAEERLRDLRAVLPYVTHVHVFQWQLVDGAVVRLALADEWRSYLDLLKGSAQPRYALLEFVAGDAPEQFLADAATLQGML